MEEIVIKVDIPVEFKKEFESALIKIIEQFTRNLKLLALKERLESKEERELTNWSIELGRKVNKDIAERMKKEKL